MDDEAKWKIENDVRTLKEAEIIKADPQRLKAAQSLIDEELQAMMRVKVESEDVAKKRFPTTFKQ